MMGRWDTPYKTTTIAVDPYGDLTVGGITSAMSGSGIRNVQAQFDRRDQNVVQYWSPNWAGFEFRASYSANEGRTATVNPRSNGASLTWKGGPIYVGYAYHELFDTAFGTPVLSKQQANALFGYVDIGPIRIGADFNKNMRTGLKDQNAWMGNIVWTIGNNQLSYQHSDIEGRRARHGRDAAALQVGYPRLAVQLLEAHVLPRAVHDDRQQRDVDLQLRLEHAGAHVGGPGSEGASRSACVTCSKRRSRYAMERGAA